MFLIRNTIQSRILFVFGILEAPKCSQNEVSELRKRAMSVPRTSRSVQDLIFEPPTPLQDRDLGFQDLIFQVLTILETLSRPNWKAQKQRTFGKNCVVSFVGLSKHEPTYERSSGPPRYPGNLIAGTFAFDVFLTFHANVGSF